MDLQGRVAKLERAVADLVASFRRSGNRSHPMGDPVALTATMHPRGLREWRPRSEAEGMLSLRFFLFDATNEEPAGDEVGRG